MSVLRAPATGPGRPKRTAAGVVVYQTTNGKTTYNGVNVTYEEPISLESVNVMQRR